MKHKVGDKVRIKSREWYEENKDEDGYLSVNNCWFVESMAEYLGKEATIVDDGVGIYGTAYRLDIDNAEWEWIDDFFEDTPTDIIKDIAEVIRKHNLCVSVKEEYGKLIIEPLNK